MTFKSLVWHSWHNCILWHRTSQLVESVLLFRCYYLFKRISFTVKIYVIFNAIYYIDQYFSHKSSWNSKCPILIRIDYKYNIFLVSDVHINYLRNVLWKALINPYKYTFFFLHFYIVFLFMIISFSTVHMKN